jgi:hypothetical protein
MQTETIEEHNARLMEAVQYWQGRAVRAEALARPRAVERYYSVPETAMLLSFSERWVRDRIRAEEFVGAVEAGGELRIPASAINAFLARHERLEPGIPARTVGELQRKAAQ